MTQYKKMTLKFNEIIWSTSAKALDYLDSYPEINESLVIEILKLHFLPYKLNKSSQKNKEIAHNCAVALESRARAIRELWDLPTHLYQGNIDNNVLVAETKLDRTKNKDQDSEQTIPAEIGKAVKGRREKILGL